MSDRMLRMLGIDANAIGAQVQQIADFMGSVDENTKSVAGWLVAINARLESIERKIDRLEQQGTGHEHHT